MYGKIQEIWTLKPKILKQKRSAKTIFFSSFLRNKLHILSLTKCMLRLLEKNYYDLPEKKNYDASHHIYKHLLKQKSPAWQTYSGYPCRMRHSVKHTDSESRYEKYLAFRGDPRVATCVIVVGNRVEYREDVIATIRRSRSRWLLDRSLTATVPLGGTWFKGAAALRHRVRILRNKRPSVFPCCFSFPARRRFCYARLLHIHLSWIRRSVV